MTINPKVKIVGGVALAGGGAFMFYQSNKATDKKKKWLYGLTGVGLVIGGFLAGKQGVVQVIGLREQGKATNTSNDPAKGVIADMAKENIEVKKPSVEKENTVRSSTLAFDNGNKNASEFDSIMSSTASSGATPSKNNIRTIPATQPKIVDKNNNIITANRNDAVKNMGARVVGKVDPKVLERNKQERQSILGTISAKESEHKKLIKLSGWHSGLPLRNEISMLKARLHYV